MDLEFPRGDTQVCKFKIKDKNGEELSLSNTDKLFFTCKKNSKSDEIVFQKTLDNGIEQRSDGYYYITINSDDTAELNYGEYGYDIELKTEAGIVKTLTIGSIALTDEFTFKGDES